MSDLFERARQQLYDQLTKRNNLRAYCPKSDGEAQKQDAEMTDRINGLQDFLEIFDPDFDWGEFYFYWMRTDYYGQIKQYY